MRIYEVSYGGIFNTRDGDGTNVNMNGLIRVSGAYLFCYKVPGTEAGTLNRANGYNKEVDVGGHKT